MKVPYFPIQHRPERLTKADKSVWTWHQTLADEALKVIGKDAEKFNIGVFTPVGAFHEPPMRKHLLEIIAGTLLEMELPSTDKIRNGGNLDASILPLWAVEVKHMIGYYLLVQWCGGPGKTTNYFWVHGGSASLHQIGYTRNVNEGLIKAHDKTNVVLLPPHAIIDQKSWEGWCAFVNQQVHGRFTVCDDFDDRLKEVNENKFKVGQRVETIHDEESFVLVPAVIKRVLGRRVLLEYSKTDIDKADYIDKPNMWKDMNDDLIYPVGFAETMGLSMTANKKYKAHVAAIAKAIKQGSDDVPYARTDAKVNDVYQWRENQNSKVEWAENMVCEMIDRLDECQNVLKAARVLKLMPDGYLQLGPEGPDIVNDSFYVHQTSPILFPVGYAKQYNINLQGPKGDKEQDFDWDSFLARTNYVRAPEHCFHEARPENVPFKVGMRLEAIDQNEKMLCPATVKEIKGRLVLVSFDGWDEEFDQLYDFRSNELLPCGWGEMVGHALQAPKVAGSEELRATEADSGDD